MLINSILSQLVPISRFNKGEANKIFDEVKEEGVKIVLKNNLPACVLIAPELYESLMESLNDYYLICEADNRMENAVKGDFVSSEDVLGELDLDPDALNNTEVEIG